MPRPPMPLQDRLIRESCSMVRHLASNGMRVSPALVQSAAGFEAVLNARQPVDLAAVAATHERLARLVSPARPGALYLLDTTYHEPERFRVLGPIGLVRQITVFAVACLVAFVGLTVHGLSGGGHLVEGAGVDVADVVLRSLHWLSAAGLGASFAMLFQVNEYIGNRTYDPAHAPSYTTKLFLGVVAGFILVDVIPLPGVDSGEAQMLAKPAIALLGGFSAQAVYRILNRLVETLENLFSGSQKDQGAAREQAATARANDEAAQHRLTVAGKLVRMQSAVSDPALAGQMRDLIHSLTPDAAAAEADPDGAPADPAVAATGNPGLASAGAAADSPPLPQPAAVPADAIIATGVPAAPLTVVMDDEPAADTPASADDASRGKKSGS